ncbi:hypothetical protein CYMTET_54466 [Cymbomonas tetramitiformis]|uniref:Uncharacterized protein n=1 Tax=Cymbomonas tetramitiformis TaxID=36881 RepID=A0AAE0BG87_9CHLO|nr:hypothetical protein CYMTET_54466 [Cymbomonas tetramitiformis]
MTRELLMLHLDGATDDLSTCADVETWAELDEAAGDVEQHRCASTPVLSGKPGMLNPMQGVYEREGDYAEHEDFEDHQSPFERGPPGDSDCLVLVFVGGGGGHQSDYCD